MRRQQRAIRGSVVATATAVAMAGWDGSGNTSTMTETTTVTVTVTSTPPTVPPSSPASSGGLDPIPGDGDYTVGQGEQDVRPGTYTSKPAEPGMHWFLVRYRESDGAANHASIGPASMTEPRVAVLVPLTYTSK
jgi:hypothetical protein